MGLENETIIEKLNNARILFLTIEIKMLKDKSIITENLDKLTFNMEWFVVKELLNIEGIDKQKLLKLWLKNLEIVFQNNEWIKIKSLHEDGCITIDDVKLNNADEIIALANIFLNDGEVAEEDKIILRNIILRNFESIINNSLYSFKTLDAIQKMGLPSKDIWDKKEKILETINGKSVPTFYSYCQNHGQKIDIETEKFAELMFNGNMGLFQGKVMGNAESEEDRILLETLKQLIAGFAKRQNVNLGDIEFIGEGFYTQTIKIGEFVLKVGEAKNTLGGIPVSKYIIEPVISYQINKTTHIEVQNLVDAKWYEGLKEEQINEEMFILYFNLREDDVIWKDVKKENVGRLLKKNSSNFYHDSAKIDEVKIPDELRGMRGRSQDDREMLQAGELVIIDRDYLEGKGVGVPRTPPTTLNYEFNEEYKKPKKYAEVLKRVLGEKEFDKRYGRGLIK